MVTGNRMNSRVLHLLMVLSLQLGLSAAAEAGESDTSTFKIGYNQRSRIETTDNVNGLSKSSQMGSSYLRHRTSLSAQYLPIRNVEINARLTNELRYYLVPESRGFEFDEVFVNILSLTVDSIGGNPIQCTVGRQDMSLGEGFLVRDGGPLDGSRSAYFNAVRVGIDLTPTDRLTLAYCYLPKEDNLLPIANNRHKKLVEQPQMGFFIYYETTLGGANLQTYFLRKHIYSTDGVPLSARINCPGFRIQYPLISNLAITGEAAYQFGSWAGHTMSAFGGYAYGTYKTGWRQYLPQSFAVGTYYLSGDDRSSETYNAWDPLFSRYPKWSDSFIYALIPERGVAYWSNIASLFVKTSIPISPEITFSVEYHHLLAPEGSDVPALFGGGGTRRGELVIANLSYKANQHLTGHVLYEGFSPGDFYFPGADPYAWVRMEVMVQY